MSDDIVMQLSSSSSPPDPSLPTKLAKLEARMAGKSSSSLTIQSAWQSAPPMRFAEQEELPDSSSDDDNGEEFLIQHNIQKRQRFEEGDHDLAIGQYKETTNGRIKPLESLEIRRNLDESNKKKQGRGRGRPSTGRGRGSKTSEQTRVVSTSSVISNGQHESPSKKENLSKLPLGNDDRITLLQRIYRSLNKNMGMAFSFPIVCCDAMRGGLEALLTLGGNFRSSRWFIGFNGRDSKYSARGRLPIQGSVSLTGSDMDLPAEPDKSRRPGHLRKRSLDSILIQPDSPKHEAAVKLQKVYKSFRTRRQLADCAVLVEQRWWKLLDFALLRRSSVSFFDIDKQESAVSRWSRAKSRAAKVGKGLSKDEKARKLALQHWLEAIDPRHRYGHNLQFYYDCWLQSESMQPFFYWLDVGEGKEVNLEQQCARSKLQQQCIKYLGPKEREAYEVIIDDRKFVYEQSRQVLDTSDGPEGVKWIFVLSTSKKLCVAQKKKGIFQHSSFLAGGATSAAGQLVVENGVLKAVWPHSGHYRPTEKNFQEFMSFLEENNVDLTDVKTSPTEEDGELCIRLRRGRSELNLAELNVALGELNLASSADTKLGGEEKPGASLGISDLDEPIIIDHSKESEEEMDESKFSVKEPNRVSSCTKDEQTPIPSELIFRRINSKRVIRSYQLGKKLSCKWTTGAGPRIGCVRDYPSELQFRALEEVNLSLKSFSRSKFDTAN